MGAQQSKNEPSSVDDSAILFQAWKGLRCSQCKKYLSVPPIFTIDEVNNICGRCTSYHLTGTRNQLYENLAKVQQFPCSLSKNCNERLKWEQVLAHEEVCEFRPIVCPHLECNDVMEVRRVGQHFSENHKIIKSGSFELSLPDTSTIYLSEFDKNTFLIGIFIYEDAVGIKVSSLLIGKLDHSFCVTLYVNKNSIELRESSIIRPWLEKEKNLMSEPQFAWKKTSLENIFKNCHFNELKVHFNLSKDIELGSKKNLLISILQCPVCYNEMKTDIINCPRGHSICSDCYRQITKKECPTCRVSFTNDPGRNYVLEAVSREIFEN
ncbi:uncharacterized protein LOC132702601 [Cylas formicarius]|uniref:uncharacterized protein LOC132702601 n=1 Tax=Cylas formicarius TaxID=197179 RepID=UPI0029583625|nr:uncharacterized protein LOC132702601 [Cylas formicarius]